jgi:hypothetical protein
VRGSSSYTSRGTLVVVRGFCGFTLRFEVSGEPQHVAERGDCIYIRHRTDSTQSIKISPIARGPNQILLTFEEVPLQS